MSVELRAGWFGALTRSRIGMWAGNVAVDKRGSVVRSAVDLCKRLSGRSSRLSGFVPVIAGLPKPFAVFAGVAQRVYR